MSQDNEELHKKKLALKMKYLIEKKEVNFFIIL